MGGIFSLLGKYYYNWCNRLPLESLTDKYSLPEKPYITGRFSSIYVGNNLDTGITVAVKRISTKTKSANKQSHIVSKLVHPNIIHIIDTYQTGSYNYIVMELGWMDLYTKMERHVPFPEERAIYYMKQLLDAVAYLHSIGIVHRDIKPENIVIVGRGNYAELKLIDFDFAKHFTPDHPMKRIMGSPLYMAPEVLRGNYTELCDVWSVGVILYEMLSGTLPFEDLDRAKLFQKIHYQTLLYDGSEWSKVSELAIQTTKQFLERDTKKRLSAGTVLMGPWFVLKNEISYLI